MFPSITSFMFFGEEESSKLVKTTVLHLLALFARAFFSGIRLVTTFDSAQRLKQTVLIFPENNKRARISIGSKEATILTLRAGKPFDVINQKKAAVVSVTNI